MHVAEKFMLLFTAATSISVMYTVTLSYDKGNDSLLFRATLILIHILNTNGMKECYMSNSK